MKTSISKAIGIIKKSIQYHRANPNTRKLEYCLLGPPGIGKSTSVIQMAKELNMKVSILTPSSREKEDWKGVPSINWDDLIYSFQKGNKENLKVKYTRPDYLDSDIIFIDEITNAELYEFTPIAQLITERRCGEHELNPNTFIIAAGNRPEDSVLARDLPSIITTRFNILEIDVNTDEFIDYMMKNKWESEIIAFVERNQSLLHSIKMDEVNKSFLCPRTLEKANVTIKMYKENFIDQTERDIMLESELGKQAKSLIVFIDKLSNKISYKELKKWIEECNDVEFMKNVEKYNKNNEAVLISTVVDLVYYLQTEHINLKKLKRSFNLIQNNIANSVYKAMLLKEKKDGRILDQVIEKVSEDKNLEISQLIEELNNASLVLSSEELERFIK
jgi:hypothetical protein